MRLNFLSLTYCADEIEPVMWNDVILACGSNAFNQCGFDSLEIMCTLLKAVNCSTSDCEVESVSAGQELSSAVLVNSSRKRSGYLWGSGLPGGVLRIPTLLSINNVRVISCGQAHVGAISTAGVVYTWGCGEHGRLGHGTKQNVATPRIVQSLHGLNCLNISCGGFHSAFICAKTEEVFRFSGPLGDLQEVAGTLFCCGLAKAGQLGIGRQKSSFVAIPTECMLGLKVWKASCGLNHTVCIAVDHLNPESTHVYSFGWGEHGRLGVGDEEQRMEPTLIEFPTPFQPSDVSCGDQHTLCLGLNGNCYSWGSNSMGQLGVGNPQSTEQCMTPVKVQMPEGMIIVKISAGGRHSGAITDCGKLLTWGWGEEGQLGVGSERNSYLPRPCRVPRVKGHLGIPRCLSLGLTHTVLVAHNPDFQAPSTSPAIEDSQVVTNDVVSVEVVDVVSNSSDEVEVVEVVEISPPEFRKKSLFSEDNCMESDIHEDETDTAQDVVLCGIKSLLLHHESDRSLIFMCPCSYLLFTQIVYSTIGIAKPQDTKEFEIVEETETDLLGGEDIDATSSLFMTCLDSFISQPVAVGEEPRDTDDEVGTLMTEAAEIPVDATFSDVSVKDLKVSKMGVYYKEGQDLSQCLIANTAKRVISNIYIFIACFYPNRRRRCGSKGKLKKVKSDCKFTACYNSSWASTECKESKKALCSSSTGLESSSSILKSTSICSLRSAGGGTKSITISCDRSFSKSTLCMAK